ncbi:MFS transporter [Streptomyces sp. sk2.1]|nr:MFS transporter [Streptomyces sp. sk2.1]
MYLVSRWADVRQMSASPAQFSSGRGHVIDQPRAVQGIEAAVLSPLSLTLLTSEFHDAKLRARVLAAWGGVAAAAGAAGDFVGGLVTQYLSWRWTMLINVPIALLVLVPARGTVAGRVRGTAWRTPDVVGALAVTGGLVACVYGVEPGRRPVLGAGPALLAFFAVWEPRGARELLPIPVLRNRSVSVANVGMSLFAMWFFLSLHLQNQRGFGPLETGLAFLPQYLAIVAGAQLGPPAAGVRSQADTGGRGAAPVGRLRLAVRGGFVQPVPRTHPAARSPRHPGPRAGRHPSDHGGDQWGGGGPGRHRLRARQHLTPSGRCHGGRGACRRRGAAARGSGPDLPDRRPAACRRRSARAAPAQAVRAGHRAGGAPPPADRTERKYSSEPA